MKIKIQFFLILLIICFSSIAFAQQSETHFVKQVKAPKASIERMKELSPAFAKLTEDVLFNDIWNRPGLSARDKSLITISVLVATNRPDQAESHIKLGLENGLTLNEIEATMTHIAFYAGWPSAVSGLQKLRDVKDNKGKMK